MKHIYFQKFYSNHRNSNDLPLEFKQLANCTSILKLLHNYSTETPLKLFFPFHLQPQKTFNIPQKTSKINWIGLLHVLILCSVNFEVSMTCHKENNLVFWCGGHHSKVGWVVVLWKITAQANLDKNNWLYAPRTQRTSHVRIAVLMAWLIQRKQDMLESLILSLGFTDLLTPSAEMFSICCSCFWLLLPIASVQSSYLLVALLRHSLIRYFMKKLLCASFCRSFRTKQNQFELLVEYFPEYLFIFVTLQSVLPNKPRILSTTVDHSLLNLIKKQMTAGVLSVSWVLTKDLYSTLHQQQLSF